MGCTQREPQFPVRIDEEVQALITLVNDRSSKLNTFSFYCEYFWTAISHPYSMLELCYWTPVYTPERRVRFQESDACEFLNQRIPLSSDGFLFFSWKWLLEEGVGPSLRKGEGRIPFFDVSGHCSTKRFQFLLCYCTTNGYVARDSMNVG